MGGARGVVREMEGPPTGGVDGCPWCRALSGLVPVITGGEEAQEREE